MVLEAGSLTLILHLLLHHVDVVKSCRLDHGSCDHLCSETSPVQPIEVGASKLLLHTACSVELVFNLRGQWQNLVLPLAVKPISRVSGIESVMAQSIESPSPASLQRDLGIDP